MQSRAAGCYSGGGRQGTRTSRRRCRETPRRREQSQSRQARSRGQDVGSPSERQGRTVRSKPPNEIGVYTQRMRSTCHPKHKKALKNPAMRTRAKRLFDKSSRVDGEAWVSVSPVPGCAVEPYSGTSSESPVLRSSDLRAATSLGWLYQAAIVMTRVEYVL